MNSGLAQFGYDRRNLATTAVIVLLAGIVLLTCQVGDYGTVINLVVVFWMLVRRCEKEKSVLNEQVCGMVDIKTLWLWPAASLPDSPVSHSDWSSYRTQRFLHLWKVTRASLSLSVPFQTSLVQRPTHKHSESFWHVAALHIPLVDWGLCAVAAGIDDWMRCDRTPHWSWGSTNEAPNQHQRTPLTRRLLPCEVTWLRSQS